MPSLDVFRSDAFSVVSLTDAINKAPYKPGRIGALGLFRERGITTTTAMIEERRERLSLIQTTPRGSGGDAPENLRRKMRSLVVPHLERADKVYAEEVQNVRAFGSESETQSVQALVAERLAELRAMHEVTLEYHRVKALQGIILDADGSTLLDLFDAFDVVQQTAMLDLSANVRSQIVAVQRQSESALGGEPITGYRAICGDTFFDLLIDSSDVKDSLKYQESALLRGDLRSGFEYGGITWENYRGKLSADLADPDDEAKDVDGDSVTPFVPDGEAHVFPVGPNIYATYFAPADYLETVNTVGLPVYAKQAVDTKWNKFVEIQTQSNPLCLVKRPRSLVKVTLAT